jgi:hypothetical protein
MVWLKRIAGLHRYIFFQVKGFQRFVSNKFDPDQVLLGEFGPFSGLWRAVAQFSIDLSGEDSL